MKNIDEKCGGNQSGLTHFWDILKSTAAFKTGLLNKGSSLAQT
jgi:hypothetical protein